VFGGQRATRAEGRARSWRERHIMGATRSLALAAAWLIAFLGCPFSSAAEPRPRSVLVLDQAETTSPFYYAIYAGIRSTLAANPSDPVSIYLQSLELDRFSGPSYEASLTSYLRSKYKDRPPEALVAVGAAALQVVLRLRPELWPEVPVVFCMVDEPTLARLNLGPGMTGNFIRLRLSDMMTVARSLVPNLKHVALVGDAWETQTVFGHFKEEVPAATAGVGVIDLVGLPLADVRKRVVSLPEATAILYTAMYSDGAGTALLAREALSRFADVANAPVVGAAETFIGAGATGGFVMQPAAIGSSAGRIALRILNGEHPSQIPVTMADVVRPAYDWRRMERWAVSEANLPAGSDIRFREPSAWDRYRWEIVAIAAVMLLQAALIIGLLYQRQRRRAAEVDARQRMAELAHMNRQATVGHLSASIAHELNQPLGAILNNVEAAVMLVDAGVSNGRELKAILGDIKRDDQRASEVIKRLRHLLTRGTVDPREVDVNEVVREVFDILSALAAARDVKLGGKLAQQRLRVRGDRVQLEQVILNLLVNGIEAIAGAPNGAREIDCRSWASDGQALISIRDSGPGIPSDHLEQLFEPFFTTKGDGMGMGLCIARTIIEAHGGKISAETRPSGAVFHISLPMAKTQRA
jgi:signal transduction histidine kinase